MRIRPWHLALSLLVVATVVIWLSWVSLVGVSVQHDCVDDPQSVVVDRCADAPRPSWSAPTRGLSFSIPLETSEWYWMFGAVTATTALLALFQYAVSRREIEGAGELSQRQRREMLLRLRTWPLWAAWIIIWGVLCWINRVSRIGAGRRDNCLAYDWAPARDCIARNQPNIGAPFSGLNWSRPIEGDTRVWLDGTITTVTIVLIVGVFSCANLRAGRRRRRSRAWANSVPRSDTEHDELGEQREVQ